MNHYKAYAGVERRGSKWLRFDPLKASQMPPAPACYAIYIDGRLVYVGQTVDLRNRFHLHNFRFGYKPGVITPWGDVPHGTPLLVKARLSERIGDWAMREVRLIRRLKPLHNVHHIGRASRKAA